MGLGICEREGCDNEAQGFTKFKHNNGYQSVVLCDEHLDDDSVIEKIKNRLF